MPRPLPPARGISPTKCRSRPINHHQQKEANQMASKSISVFGIYKSLSEAELAVDALLKSGLTQDDISVLLPDNESTRQLAHVKETKAPEGTTTGATTGGVVGGAIGLLAGIGALAIPGL